MTDLKTLDATQLKDMLRELGAKIPPGKVNQATLVKAVRKAQKAIHKTEKNLKKLDIDQSDSGIADIPQGEDEVISGKETVLDLEKELGIGTKIVSLTAQPTVLDAIGIEVKEQPKPRMGACSEQQVIEAVRNYAARGMTIKFLDNTWEFRKGDKIDTGTMSQPVYNIVKCAEAICRESVSASRMFKGNI